MEPRLSDQFLTQDEIDVMSVESVEAVIFHDLSYVYITKIFSINAPRSNSKQHTSKRLKPLEPVFIQKVGSKHGIKSNRSMDPISPKPLSVKLTIVSHLLWDTGECLGDELENLLPYASED